MAEIHTYAIGDVHGCADLLESLLSSISKQASASGFDYNVVFLGDIIDRGPGSKQAMQLVVDTINEHPGSALILGNHDWFPIRILDELEPDKKDAGLTHWIYEMGGDATIQSYGFDPDDLSVDDLRKVFPDEHLQLLRNARRFVCLHDYTLVHAGVVPGIPLADQKLYDLMWIREPFLTAGGQLDSFIIHGHTVNDSHLPEVYGDRIGLDTGAYRTGRLSAVHILPDRSLEFVASMAAGVHPVEPQILKNWGLSKHAVHTETEQLVELPPSIKAIQESFRPRMEAQTKRMAKLAATAFAAELAAARITHEMSIDEGLRLLANVAKSVERETPC